MKSITTLLFIFSINLALSQNDICKEPSPCSDMEKVLLEIKKQESLTKIYEKTLWKAATFALQQIIGKAGGVIGAYLGSPKHTATGVDFYWDAYKKIQDLTNRSSYSVSELQYAMKQLKDAQNMILLERDFGNYSSCYVTLKELTSEILSCCNVVCRAKP